MWRARQTDRTKVRKDTARMAGFEIETETKIERNRDSYSVLGPAGPCS